MPKGRKKSAGEKPPSIEVTEAGREVLVYRHLLRQAMVMLALPSLFDIFERARLIRQIFRALEE